MAQALQQPRTLLSVQTTVLVFHARTAGAWVVSARFLAFVSERFAKLTIGFSQKKKSSGNAHQHNIVITVHSFLSHL